MIRDAGPVDGRMPARRRWAALPHAVTAVRVALGAAALLTALEGDNLARAATFIVLAAVSDGLDGHLARRLRVASAFGERFDALADYLAFVVAPWMMMRSVLLARRSLWQELLIDAPLLAGAWRLARAGSMAAGEERQAGLDTVFFACVGVVTIFLHLPGLASAARLATILTPVIAVLSVLMVAPLRYPRATGCSPWTLGLLMVVAAWPFVQPELMSMAAVIAGTAYILVGPLFADPVCARPSTGSGRATFSSSR